MAVDFGRVMNIAATALAVIFNQRRCVSLQKQCGELLLKHFLMARKASYT